MRARALWLLLLAGGCSSDVMQETEFCRALAQAECEAVAGHCGVGDPGTCVAQREIDCRVVSGKLFTAGKGFNPVGAGVCLGKVKTTFRKSFITAEERREIDRACVNSYWGQRAPGEGCTFHRECQADDQCQDDKCTPRMPPAERNGRCTPARRLLCVEGHRCESSPGAGMVCVPLPETGMACTPGGGCREDARCEANTCVARLPLRAPCLNDGECAPPSAFCDPALGRCELGFTVTPPSAFCQPFRRGLSTDAAADPRADARARVDGAEAAEEVDAAGAPDVAPDLAGDSAPDSAGDGDPDGPDVSP